MENATAAPTRTRTRTLAVKEPGAEVTKLPSEEADPELRCLHRR